jgi:hypothetical protein
MESNNSLAEKPFPSTNLAAQCSFLDQVSQNLLAQTNDKGRGEESVCHHSYQSSSPAPRDDAHGGVPHLLGGCSR